MQCTAAPAASSALVVAGGGGALGVVGYRIEQPPKPTMREAWQ